MLSVVDCVESSAPIEDVALAIASDEYPGLDVDHYRDVLDVWAEQAQVTVDAADRLPRKLVALARLVYRDLGFVGNQEDYYDPKNSFLNDVIERRKGIPISMAVVLMAL
ncbi:MAG: transglutaminase family protein, partial [Polyangiaceae bacterium]